MSDLIGRFLSFEEHLGRGLVKFAYYVALFYLVVIALYDMIGYLFGGFKLGQFLLVPFQFLLSVLVLRIAAEFMMAILSIDDNLQGANADTDGFEAGLTPQPAPSTTMHPTNAPAAAEEKPADVDPAPQPSTKDDDPIS